MENRTDSFSARNSHYLLWPVLPCIVECFVGSAVFRADFELGQ